ncbi:MAG: CocE/NonD family hydrolase [Nitrososphaerales archaeon]
MISNSVTNFLFTDFSRFETLGNMMKNILASKKMICRLKQKTDLNQEFNQDARMFGLNWESSARKYHVLIERDVKARMSDGIRIDLDLFRPRESDGTRFPAILGAHPYSKAGQTEPIKVNSTSAIQPHAGEERTRGSLEAGDPYFFARRGYAHAIANVRGTGKSEGQFVLLGEREIQDVCELVQWLAEQPWCDGNVGMFGVSYFAMIQFLVASLNPPHLKCIFAPWGTTDMYREMFYHGGILASRWTVGWPKTSFVYGNVRPNNEARREHGAMEFKQNLSRLLEDEDLKVIPEFVEAIRNPDSGYAPFIADILLHCLDSPFWEKRRPKCENIKIPAYLGGDWGIYRSHLPAAFASWELIKTPKRMIIGPPAYLDRPVYQLEYESLRWFDHWLKGIDTGMMEEPPILLFVQNTGRWKKASSWPLPETKWTPFYLHEDSLLCERDYWPNEGSSSFFDSPWSRGYIEFFSPPLVEETEVLGPLAANIYASTTDSEVFWSLRVFEVDAKEGRKILTGGWLKGSHREVDASRSKPWYPFHPHARSEPLEPGKIYEFKIGIVPTGILLKAGAKLGLRISCVDYDSETSIGGIAAGHLKRQRPSRITVFHDEHHPSHLLVPVTDGNVLGTFISGGKPYV